MTTQVILTIPYIPEGKAIRVTTKLDDGSDHLQVSARPNTEIEVYPSEIKDIKIEEIDYEEDPRPSQVPEIQGETV